VEVNRDFADDLQNLREGVILSHCGTNVTSNVNEGQGILAAGCCIAANACSRRQADEYHAGEPELDVQVDHRSVA